MCARIFRAVKKEAVMRYLLRQRFFAFADSYNIEDANGRPRFMVKGKFFTIGKKFWICQLNGQEIFYIKQRLFRFFPTFSIYQGDNEIGKFKGKFALFVKRAKITSQYGDFKVKGNVFAWDFNVENDGNAVMSISKKILRIADSYTVDIAEGVPDAFMLAVAVMIDATYQRKR